jgi:hypothetical protein
MTRRVRKPRKKVKTPVATLTIPGNLKIGPIKTIAKLVKAFPGRMKVKIVVSLDDPKCLVDITTEETVSKEGLREIASTFPSISITPKLL